MADFLEYLSKITDELGKLEDEVKILRAAIDQAKSTSEAMEIFVNTGSSEIFTKTPIYKDVETAKKMMNDEVTAYVKRRMTQVFGDG